jgi:uncharacterized protein (TIGR02099 family)
MKAILRKILKYLAYLGAALVILLAVAVGIFRLMLPRLPEYQEEIKDWASAAIGMTVEFSGMNARWRLSGPEVSFFDAELFRVATGERILTTQEVSVGVGLLRLIADRELVVDRILIRSTVIDLRQDEDGNWLLQGESLDDLRGSRETTTDFSGDLELVGEDITVNYEHPASGQLLPFSIVSVSVSRDSNETGVDALLDLPDEFGNELEISANQLVSEAGDGVWRYFLEADGLNLEGWSRLRSPGWPEMESGRLDLSVWLDVANGELMRATSNVVAAGLRVGGAETTALFGIQGSFEFSTELNGWLLAANQFRLTTVDGDWPESSLQIRVNSTDDGELEAVRATASYFKLDDLAYVSPWLAEEQQAQLAELAPAGVLRDLRTDISQMQTERPLFDLTTDLDRVGFFRLEEQPGIQGFSGRLRADRDGGRIEIESTDLVLDLGAHLPEPVSFDDALGTIIWRRNNEGVTVLSDSVRLRNADIDSESNLQISVPANGDSPYVDFESSWSVYDVGSVGRYLPLQYVQPNLYRWLSDALVSGYVTRGTARFNGALDKFPFDDGDGLFRVDAKIEDATLKYAETWPAAEFRHLDLVFENTRLYSTENSALNLGNNVEDAVIEIADLREPVLKIDAFATGTLESIRQYVIQSPIHDVLGGQLDRVTVDGDASFDLSLTVPLHDRLNFDFLTSIRSSDGTIQVQGFAAPVSELNGVVTVSREEISSEALFGRFLGQPVDIALRRANQATSGYSVVLEATGQVTASGLEAELGLPMTGVGNGQTDYLTTIRFPNGRAEVPGPLQIQIDSDLIGFGLELPEPLMKLPGDMSALSLTIEFPSADRISTTGSLDGEYNWNFHFTKEDSAWDFDRGVLAVGGEYPADASIRGLRIDGETSEVRLQDWLDMARRDGSDTGLGSRIRSIDLTVDNLYAIGQHYEDHRVQVNRSGLDWVVQISGELAEGTITVPYDFRSGRAMTLEMERLTLPGSDEEVVADKDIASADPRGLPSITVNAAEFALGARKLGKLSIDLQHTSRGLESTNLSIDDDTFTIEGSAGWIIDAYEESGQRTFIDAVLTSTDVEQTMLRLDYEPGISGEDMHVEADVSWSGGPRQDFMRALNGTVSVRLGAGQLEDVEPGAGRVFGLMSVVALPRRLSLDFRDVFNSGFGFDEISGDFRIVMGEAYTCNLSLTGPAADVGIIGRAGLVNRDYSQAAVVSANVGNTLPIAGFVIAGPQVAAALLIFSQLFKKPLSSVAQISYSIDGLWDDPVIDNATSEQFGKISSLAGCSDTAQ